MIKQVPYKFKFMLIGLIPIAFLIASALLSIDSESLAIDNLPLYTAIVGIVVSTLIGFGLYKNITASIALLNESASSLTRSGPFKNANISENDELGKISQNLLAIHENNFDRSMQQESAIVEGVSEIVINLARRSMSMLDRQISELESLERNEQDPEKLSRLFKADHLATRMKRTNDSLLVLADADPGLRKGDTVKLSEVMRSAMSQVENYKAVKLAHDGDGKVSQTNAVDLAHLLAEIIDNSTKFSSPDTPVEIIGMLSPNGDYKMKVIDHGVGMSQEQLNNANAIISNPPELDLNLARSLGFSVVGRLAKRIGLNVALMQTPGLGITAIIIVPANLLNNVEQTISTYNTKPTFDPTKKRNSVTARQSNLGSKTTKQTTQKVKAETATRAKTETSKKSEVANTKEVKAGENKQVGSKTNSKIRQSAKQTKVVKKKPDEVKSAISSPHDLKSKGILAAPDETKQLNKRNLTQIGDGGELSGNSGLEKRVRGASKIVVGQERIVAADNNAKPGDVRSMLSIYREGIKGSDTETPDDVIDELPPVPNKSEVENETK